MQGSHACLSTALCAGVSAGRIPGRPFQSGRAVCHLSPSASRATLLFAAMVDGSPKRKRKALSKTKFQGTASAALK